MRHIFNPPASAFFYFVLFISESSCCVFLNGSYDFTPVKGIFSVIDPVHPDYQYDISLCEPLKYQNNPAKENCANSSVCVLFNNTALSLGDYKPDFRLDKGFLADWFDIFMISSQDKNCDSFVGMKARAVISFSCGKHLGSPILYQFDSCQAFFHWRTSVVCKKSVQPQQKEVRCYSFDNNQKKVDLTPLIKTSGGYEVEATKDGKRFFINVCSNLYPDDLTKGCPNGAAACEISDTGAISFGSVSEGLFTTSSGIVLILEGPGATEDCLMQTKIVFRCPPRNKPQPPRVIYSSKCNYVVDWQTEYACPEHTIKANVSTCAFTDDVHGLNIDLSQLRSKDGYNVTGTVNGTERQFSFNVCGNVNSSCSPYGDRKVAACMYDPATKTSVVIGTTPFKELKYADSELVLTYRAVLSEGGEVPPETIINFKCNPENNSNPQHAMSINNTHVFEWETPHACIEIKPPITCNVMKNGKIIDLKRLKKSNGNPWKVLYENQNKQFDVYSIEICSVSEYCPYNSAICKLSIESGETVSLGSFNSAPYYDSKSDSVILNYTNGDRCKNNMLYSTLIYLKCSPGYLNKPPMITNIDECITEVTWFTANACPLETVTGSKCQIYNSELGLSFDLSPLKSVYQVPTQAYNFSLSVCSGISDGTCGKSAMNNISACAINNQNGNITIIGEVNDTLVYNSENIQLHYASGNITTTIIFICTEGAGNKIPMFLSSENGNYEFLLYTDLVCPQLGYSDCTTYDPASNQMYDLTSLSRISRNWVVDESDTKSFKKSYINLCQPLFPEPGCSRNAAVCVIEDVGGKEKRYVSNAGQALSDIKFIENGHLELLYTNGDNCTAFGHPVSYSTRISFLCSSFTQLETGPRYMGMLGACEYTYLWSTKAACPTEDLLVKDKCVLTDIESGTIFDLSSLSQKTKPYVVQTGNKTYHLNICGPVSGGCSNSEREINQNDVSVCEINKEGQVPTPLAVSTSYSLQYTKQFGLKLKYKSSNSTTLGMNVVISFLCSENAISPVPEFFEKTGKELHFKMKTKLACQGLAFDCRFTHGDKMYDLSPLAQNGEGYWIAKDYRKDFQYRTYQISFCRPLHTKPNSVCFEYKAAACLINATGISDESSLGSIPDVAAMDDPAVGVSDGQIVVIYKGGQKCGNTDKKSQTRITLTCSTVQGSLTFVGESLDCEYIFSMKTPAACHLQVIKGSNCTVKDTFGHTFDLSPLKFASQVVKVNEFSYSLGICEALGNATGTCNGSAVCQTKPQDPNFMKSLGQPSSNLTYDDGIITLNYVSGSVCHKKYTRSTQIEFTCDHSANLYDSHPRFIDESEDCTYMFTWPTKYACPPPYVQDCTVTDDKGNFYDFTPLSLTNDNYFVFHDNKTFVINVCRNVIPVKGAVCSYQAAACTIDPNATEPSQRVLNIGMPSRPSMYEGKLTLRYIAGDICLLKKPFSFMETVINFICDESQLYSTPQFVGVDDCTHHFDWYTAYACSWKEPDTFGNCTVADPITGYLYNLSSLTTTTSYVVQSRDHQFHMNVCGSVATSPCGKTSGVCQVEKNGSSHWNAGTSNSNLQYSDGSLILTYTDGDTCHDGAFKRRTIIQFLCGNSEPTFVLESSNCTYIFIWNTLLACHPLIHCAVRNGSDHFDLSPLMLQPYHIAESLVDNDSDTIYYISACGSLGMIPDVNCPPTASICRVPKNGEHESLGEGFMPPFVDFENQVTAIYRGGSSCEPNKSKVSRIIFLCDPNELLGQPKLVQYINQKYSDCTYVFEWRTSLVCPSKNVVDKDLISCVYKDVRKGIYFDLSSARDLNSYHTVKDGKGGVYLLNVCGNVSSSKLVQCTQSSVCYQDNKTVENFGLSSSSKFDYNGQRLILTTILGDDCPAGNSGKLSSEILFECDPEAGVGVPVLKKRFRCLVTFTWKTALVCRNFKHSCNFNMGDSQYDLYLLSSISHNWNTTDDKGNKYWLNLCRGIMQNEVTSGCPPSSAVCMQNSDGSHIPLGMVYSMEVKKNNTDLLMIYKSHSNTPCTKPGVNASARISLSCGPYLGAPKYLLGPDDSCYFDFMWETSLACPEKAEVVYMNEKGYLFEKELNFSLDLNPILHKSFNVTGTSGKDNYQYHIKFDGIRTCNDAAVCQFKLPKHSRNIGSFNTTKFIRRGSELHLTMTSNDSQCGKDRSRNVTTVINMECATAGNDVGEPKFLYESSGCDYIFQWGTYVVCAFNRAKENSTTSDKHKGDNHDQQAPVASSSPNAGVIVSLLILVCICSYIIFVMSKAERRSAMASKFRGCFSRVAIPRFRYKRWDNVGTLSFDDDMLPKSLYDNSEDENVLL